MVELRNRARFRQLPVVEILLHDGDIEMKKSKLAGIPSLHERLAVDPDDSGSSSVRLRAQRSDAPPPQDDIAIDLELDAIGRVPAADDAPPVDDLVSRIEDDVDDGDRDAKSLTVLELRAVRRSIDRSIVTDAPAAPDRRGAHLLLLLMVSVVVAVVGLLYAFHPG
jgi:hypothetical protein